MPDPTRAYQTLPDAYHTPSRPLPDPYQTYHTLPDHSQNPPRPLPDPYQVLPAPYNTLPDPAHRPLKALSASRSSEPTTDVCHKMTANAASRIGTDGSLSMAAAIVGHDRPDDEAFKGLWAGSGRVL